MRDGVNAWRCPDERATRCGVCTSCHPAGTGWCRPVFNTKVGVLLGLTVGQATGTQPLVILSMCVHLYGTQRMVFVCGVCASLPCKGPCPARCTRDHCVRHVCFMCACERAMWGAVRPAHMHPVSWGCCLCATSMRPQTGCLGVVELA